MVQDFYREETFTAPREVASDAPRNLHTNAIATFSGSFFSRSFPSSEFCLFSFLPHSLVKKTSCKILFCPLFFRCFFFHPRDPRFRVFELGKTRYRAENGEKWNKRIQKEEPRLRLVHSAKAFVALVCHFFIRPRVHDITRPHEIWDENVWKNIIEDFCFASKQQYRKILMNK